MKISREVRIGIASVVIMFVAYWGITFLKGSNILSSVSIYKTSYVDVDGLAMSSPVMINGMKVGTVIRVEMSDVKGVVYVDFTVKGKYKIPTNSTAVLGGQSLLGGKEIELIIGDSKEMLANGAQITSRIDNGMMDAATDIAERVSSVVDSLAVSLAKINQLLSSDMISNTQGTISNLNSSTATLSGMLAVEKVKIGKITSNLSSITGDVNEMMPDVKGAIANINHLSDSLNQSLPSLIAQIEEMVTQINSETGSMGKLLNDTALYDNATITMEEAAALLKDLKENPKRYVQFSLFGKKEKKVKQ